MTDARGSETRSLTDWEQWLQPQVRQVELLGELGITAGECAELGDALCQRLGTLNRAQIWTVVRRNYPHSTAVYLVAQGIHGYRGGNYWGEVCRVTGLPETYTALLGRLFLTILQNLGLPVFPEMPGHVYVATILAHGGVPNYCLPDFFDKVLRRAMTRPEYADVTAAELAEDLQSSSVGYFIDKPVLRFLQYGGEVAEDFFSRCRDMARAYVETDMIPSVEDIGLPSRVVEAYEQWVADQEDQCPHPLVPTRERLGLRKPDILLDPWGDGVSLLLHPQRVPASLSGAQLSWVVKTDHAEFAVATRARPFGGDLQTKGESLLLPRPSSVYEISFYAGGEHKRTWRYSGPDEEHPLVIFRPETGTIVSSRRSVPEGMLWLLFRDDLEPHCEGRADCLEELPRLPGFWSDYRGQCWDLTGTTSFSLLQGEDSIVTLVVRPDESKLRPHYVGGRLLSSGQSDPSVSLPTYVGTLPSIRVPRAARRSLEEELSRWRLWVCADGPGRPQIDTKFVLTDLPQHLKVNERHIDVPLEAKDLLGARSVGTFSVRIRGPMGRRAELPLRVLRPIEITGHERLYFPEAEQGPMPVTLEVRVEARTTVECQAEAEDCEVLTVHDEPDQPRRFLIRASPEASSADLAIITKVSAQQSVHIPLSVPIRRLRWALVGEQGDPELTKWSAGVISRATHTFLEATAPSLLVDLPRPEHDRDLQLRLSLSDIDGVELQSQEAVLGQRGRRFFRFDMRAYADTVRLTKSPVLHFELEGLAPLQEGAPARVPVVSLTQQLRIEDVRLVGRTVDNRMRVAMKWSEPTPLSHRWLRFWPIHRPWETPYELSIPDEAQGQFSFEAPRPKLGAGKYRLEFLILDPWAASAQAQTPKTGAPGTWETELVGTDERLDEIDAAIDEAGERFDLLLERALILRDTGDQNTVQQSLEWCFLHLGQATIPQVLALAEVLSGGSDTDLMEHLRFLMFAPDRVLELVNGRAQGAVSGQDFMAYLAYVPRLDALPSATFGALLGAQDAPLRLRAAGELVRRSATEGMEAILEWTSHGSLSDRDALELCGLNPEFAFDFLESKADNSVAHRLLLALSRQELSIVRVVGPGTWIQSNVGWGRIDRIEESVGGLRVDSFIKSKLNHRLYVTLRPEGDAERVIIDLQSGSIRFPKAGAIATCTKCYRFSTAKHNWAVIKYYHNRAVHGGVGARFIYEDVSTKVLQEWTYSNIPPRNQYA